MTAQRLRIVVFDGDCGFCRDAVRLGRALDWLGRIEWRARTDPRLRGECPRITSEETRREMISIAPDGGTLGGFYAVRDVAILLPLTVLPGLLLFLPGAAALGVRAYAWIAGRRR